MSRPDRAYRPRELLLEPRAVCILAYTKQTTASGSLSLFVNLVNKADDELQSKIVRILFDLFMVHDIPQLVAGVMTVSETPTNLSRAEELIERWRMSGSLSSSCSVSLQPMFKLSRRKVRPN